MDAHTMNHLLRCGWYVKFRLDDANAPDTTSAYRAPRRGATIPTRNVLSHTLR
jgi:hypothetical protein